MSVYILGSEHTGVVKFFQFWCVFEIFQNKILEKRNSMHYDVVVWHMHLKYIEKQIEIIVLKRASIQFSSVQSLSHVPLSVTPWTAARQGSLSITNSRSLLKLMSIQSVMPSNHLVLRCPQHQGLFQWVSSSHQVAKVLEVQLQHQSFQWIFRTDFL